MENAHMRWALGFMSGTSLDGVDAALLRTDGIEIEAFGPTAYRPYRDLERAALKAALARAAALEPRAAGDPAHWTTEARLVAEAHLGAAAELDLERAELVGFHGQTLLHRPEDGVTVQIGDARRLAEALHVPIVHDFRSADIASGGQGAPFAPFYHFALARRAQLSRPCAVLNMGGVGNVTFIDPTGSEAEAPGALLAFDTGPANAPLDDFMHARAGAPYDADGAAAAAGAADQALIERWIAATAFFARPAPKSLDRDDFAHLSEDLAAHSLEDGAATLTGFAAAAVREAARQALATPAFWFVTGGGRRNPTLMAALRRALGAPVEPIEALGVDGDFVEAQAFAYLAVRALRGLPLSAPGTTGCAAPACGGALARPDAA